MANTGLWISILAAKIREDMSKTRGQWTAPSESAPPIVGAILTFSVGHYLSNFSQRHAGEKTEIRFVLIVLNSRTRLGAPTRRRRGAGTGLFGGSRRGLGYMR